jgi:plastocyanin
LNNFDGEAGAPVGVMPSQFGSAPSEMTSENRAPASNRSPAGFVPDDGQSISAPALRNPMVQEAHQVQQASQPAVSVSSNSYNGPVTPFAPLGDVSAQVSQRGVQEVAVIANDLGFFPKTIFVTRDVPVRLFVTGASSNTLCIMMDSFQVRKQIRTKQIEEISFTPTAAGKYRFYCPVNGMEGSLVVKELSSDVASGPSSQSRLPASLDSQ